MYEETFVKVVDQKGKALASLVLGLVSIAAWFIPLFGLAVTITGFIMGVMGRKSSKRGMAIAGIILCCIFFVVSIINAGLGVYLFMQAMNK